MIPPAEPDPTVDELLRARWRAEGETVVAELPLDLGGVGGGVVVGRMEVPELAEQVARAHNLLVGRADLKG